MPCRRDSCLKTIDMASLSSYTPEQSAAEHETFAAPLGDKSRGDIRSSLPRITANLRQPGRLQEDATEIATPQLEIERTAVAQPQAGPVPRRRFSLLQQWEGTVLRVGRDEFDASLRDMTDPRNPLEQATFFIEEVSPGDAALLEPGAVFYWAVGYETQAGQRSRKSTIRFRHLPRWTRKDLQRVNERAKLMEDLFGAAR
jgi:hypothetical protein